jgi:polar amino acid transport system substrate-binding protein
MISCRLLAIVIIAAALATSAAHADLLSEVKSRGKMICGVSGSIPPFGFQDEKTREIVGYDVDICTAVAKQLGVAIELKLIATEARIPELARGGVDIVAAQMGYSRERAQQIDYSDTYLVSSVKIIVRHDTGITRYADLADKKMSAVKGSSPEIAIRNQIPTATILTFQDLPSAFLAVQQGKTVGLGSSEVILIKLSKQTDVATDILEQPLFLEYWGLGVRKGEPEFTGAVNDALHKLDASGEFGAIFDKWFGAGSPFPLKRNFKVTPIPL